MRMLDLFSGIGGFALAAQWVWGEDLEIVSFCEIDPFCQKVLKKHWPSVPCCTDIRELNNEWICACDQQINILTGGFPCQPFSTAGRRRGTADDRHLWPEMLRVIGETKPRWVIGENVAGLKSMVESIRNVKVESRTLARFSDRDLYSSVLTRELLMLVEIICQDLEEKGYEVQPIVIPACALNAPHRRDRIWFCAHSEADHDRGNAGELSGTNERQEGKRPQERDAESGSASVGNARNPIGMGLSGNARRGAGQEPKNGYSRSERRSWNQNWLEVAAELCGVDDGLSAKLDGFELSKSKHRENRLKALGNAIVPQVAEVIFRAIKEIEQGQGVLFEKA
jgi:DNA (cytosine-5)-methyltransferase 1